jgi:predicted nucleotidyltransferase
MRRDEVLTVLRQFKQEYAQQYGILEIGVFGSLGRDESRADSDVDICVKTQTPDPYALVHIKELIETRVHRPVDIVRVREKMNPFLKERIERDAHYV